MAASPHIFCLTNIKGGVTKSTSTVNLGYEFARMGYKTLVIDMDPQCNTTYTLTARLDEDTDGTLYDVIIKEKPAPIMDIIEETKHPNLFLAPGSIWLSSADLQLANRTNREKVLAKALRGLAGFDFVLIDTQPSLGLLTVNSMVACTSLLIPVALTIYGLIGIRLLNMSVEALRENMEQEIPVLGVIPALGDNTKNSAKRLEQVKEFFSDKVFKTVIPRNIRVEESNDQSVPLYEFAPGSTGAKAYEQLAKEVLDRVSE